MSVKETTIDPTRLARLIETEEAEFNARHKESRAMTERASRALAGGVASSWQATDPHPIYLVDGHGSKVVDVDGDGKKDVVLMYEFRSTDKTRAGGLRFFRNLG